MTALLVTLILYHAVTLAYTAWRDDRSHRFNVGNWKHIRERDDAAAERATVHDAALAVYGENMAAAAKAIGYANQRLDVHLEDHK